MKVFQWLLLLPVLLVQAMPIVSWESGKARQVVCEMDCCAWLVEAGLSEECGCIETSTAPARQSPTAPKDEAGGSKSALPVWILAFDRFQPPASGRSEATRLKDDAGADCQPHVRLPVLYCAILI